MWDVPKVNQKLKNLSISTTEFFYDVIALVNDNLILACKLYHFYMMN